MLAILVRDPIHTILTSPPTTEHSPIKFLRPAPTSPDATPPNPPTYTHPPATPPIIMSPPCDADVHEFPPPEKNSVSNPLPLVKPDVNPQQPSSPEPADRAGSVQSTHQTVADQSSTPSGMSGMQILEERRSNLFCNHNSDVTTWSVKINGAEERTDASGSTYTAYVMAVETLNPKESHTIEHRYSEFERLNRELVANSVQLLSPFPKKSLAGRVGNWTPAAIYAPEKADELVSRRAMKLDVWLVELCERLNSGSIKGELHEEVTEFLNVGSSSIPPCDRANPVSWDGLAKEDTTAKESINDGGKHAGGTEKHISNPLSFTLGSAIRQATYTVMHMCGRGTLTQSDKSIPLDLLQHAKGLCFLTVAKAGFIVSGRVGTGLIIARTVTGGWSAPSAIGTVGVGWGAQVGGDITTYLLVLNTDRAVRAFSGDIGTVNLGAELGVSVGPVGRGATGNVGGGDGGLAPVYAYAHSKGLFVGISLEGSVIKTRPEVNAKFYGVELETKSLLFENVVENPRAAQPLYHALDEAMGVSMPREGLRPSELIKKIEASSNQMPRNVGPSFQQLQIQQLEELVEQEEEDNKN